MTTWFDRERGIHSGRLSSDVVTPTDGSKIFVLGSDRENELAFLSDGDYTEVRQLIDLTGYDLLGATFKTIGKMIGQRVLKAGFEQEPLTLFAFNFDVGTPDVANLVEDGFGISPVGTVRVATENYSPDATYCRRVPEGAAESRMAGVNNPQAFPSSLIEYTIQWWMNWNSDAFDIATGTEPIILEIGQGGSGGAGLKVELSPIVGTHQWRVRLTHYASSTYSITFDSFILDEPLGWKMFTIRFDNSLTNKADLWMNTSIVSTSAAIINVPAAIPLNAPVSLLSRDLIGDIDQVRMVGRRLSDQEVVDSYEQCIVSPSPINYKWLMQILIDDILYAERQIRPDEERTWTDFTAPVRLLSGAHSVAFRLGFSEEASGVESDAYYRITEDDEYRITEEGNVRSVWP